MTIEFEKEEDHGRFALMDNGTRKGRLDVELTRKNRMVIRHTEVDRSLKGQGAGKLMLDKARDYALENGLKIIPICPYAKHMMEKHSEEYKEVMASKE